MKIGSEARLLANYIQNLNGFEMLYLERAACYNHIGAMYTDVVLQSGLNYTTVVKPRVIDVLRRYPTVDTVQLFNELIREKGLSHIINWSNKIKLDRFNRLIAFSYENEIDTCEDWRRFFSIKSNQAQILEMNGFGNKTLDYFLKLLGFDTVAVDRHIFGFFELANLAKRDYHETKMIVEFAADLLEVSRASLDHSIWRHMALGKNPLPMFLEFPDDVPHSNSYESIQNTPTGASVSLLPQQAFTTIRYS